MPPNKEQAKRLKGYLDLAEKHSDHLPHAFKGIGEPGIGILEGYRNGTVEAHIHVGIRSGLLAVSPSYFCARLKARTTLRRRPKTRPDTTRLIAKSLKARTSPPKEPKLWVEIGSSFLCLSRTTKASSKARGWRLLAERHLYGWYFSMIVLCLTWMPGILSLTFFLKTFF